MLTSTAGYPSNNTASNPNFGSQYCDGARTPPEFGASGWAVPPGISDATVPNPINMRWGPLSLVNPVTDTQLGNYALTR